jgi:toxin ParE1/3/4
MNRRIILSPDARADLNAAARWYRHQEINLSRRFKAEVRSMLLRIARHPYAFVREDAAFRRARMTRFPYYIYFRFNADKVRVTAIIHQRRSDAIWKDRIEELPEISDD